MTKIVHTIHRALPKIIDEAKERALPRRPRWERPVENQAAYDDAVAWRKKLQAENPRAEWQGEMRRLIGLDRGIQAAKTKAKESPERKARERAERDAETTVRQAVAALEIALHGLNACRAPKTYDKRINQQQIHNAVFHLKTKCGVRFEPDEFSQRLTLDGGTK